MMTTARWLILSLALLAFADSSAAQDRFSFKDAAAQIVSWAYEDECRPEGVLPPVESKTSSPGLLRRFLGGPGETAPTASRPPRIVNAGFHQETTTISEAAQQFVVKRIDQELSVTRSEDGRGVLVRNPVEAGFSEEYLHGVFGGARGQDISRAMETAEFDFIMRAAGVISKGGSVISVHFLLDAPAGGCQKRTFDIDIPASHFPSPDVSPNVIIEQAVAELSKQHKIGEAVKRVAILPPTMGSSVLKGEAHDNLVDALAEALRRAAKPARRSMGADAPPDKEALPVALLGKDSFLPDATRAGDWLAQLRFAPQHDGVQLVVDFLEVEGAIVSSTQGRIDAKYAPPAAKPSAPVTFPTDRLKLVSGKDPMRFELKVHLPAMAFCLVQEADGASVLLYPNPAEQSRHGIRMLQPRDAPLAYPNLDLVSDLAVDPMGKPGVFVLRCMTVRERPFSGEISAWMANTPRSRDPDKPIELGAHEFANLWSSLRKMSGSGEIVSVVHVTAKAE